ncbi:PfkB family carbohydrate kinase [Amycolatopsis sp. NBC_01480]|jgi:ribokinase|uniref:PfkB family carbohydrate kinase n=1 Tax=Amycolatopsis sp. NBC_01480 TaxID=2903562 RepID=UPI002E2B9FCA|nr:PfkB family carbohydrate kinase [Amycolatopsis sp. NBC_01480]
MTADVAVVGQIARDLIVLVSGRPGGAPAPVRERRELIGGKGAAIAVGLAQLGASVGLLGVVGDDEPGGRLLRQAGEGGVDTGWVVRRLGTATGLIVDVFGEDGRWRYLEELPRAVRLTPRDVAAARPLLTSAGTVVIQPQQPADATLAAAECARDAGRRVVLDGHPGEDPRTRARLLAATDVLRLDRAEGPLLAGIPLDTVEAGLRAADDLLRLGPALVVLDLGDLGCLFVWADQHLLLPHPSDGAAFTAALAWGLTRGQGPRRAARLAVAASGVAVAYPGARPDLTSEALAGRLAELDRHFAPAR